jgi:hypothetical protein
MKSIIGGAIRIGSGYINQGQNTLYYQKFDVKDNTPFTHQYMTHVLAPRSESVTAARAYDEDTRKTTALQFTIPVYRNMPETPCEQPTGDGDPNNILKSLAVGGMSLTPTFGYFTTSYDLIVEYDVSGVEIFAEAMRSAASVSGTGVYKLNVGNNTIHVTVRSESGSERVYTLHIVRMEPPPQEPQEGILSMGYNLSDNNISGITLGNTASEMLQKIVFAQGYTGNVVNADGTDQSGAVGTGDRLIVKDQNGAVIHDFPVIIYGDFNGDGKIDIYDLIEIRWHLTQTKELQGMSAFAGDIDRRKDGVTIYDLIEIRWHLTETRGIQQ